MFRKTSAADEIAQAMEKNLIKTTIEETIGVERIGKAVDYLHSAADIFDSAGLYEEAEALTLLMEKFAAKAKNSKKSKKELEEEKAKAKKKLLKKKSETEDLLELKWSALADDVDNEDQEKDECLECGDL